MLAAMKFYVHILFLAAMAMAVSLLQAGQKPAAQKEDRTSITLAVPLIRQPYNMCLVTSVSMVLQYWGIAISPGEIARRVPLYKDGTTGRDLLEFADSIGFRGFLIQPGFDDLLGHLKKGRPLIVALPGRGSLRHALVLAGYDGSSVLLNDPATGEIRRESAESFRTGWNKTHHWTFLLLPQVK